MGLETVLLALGPNDKERANELTNTVIDIAGPAGAKVVLAHVFTQEEFSEAATRLSFDNPGDASPLEVAKRHTTIREIAQRLKEAGLDHHVTAAIGDHGDSIVTLASDENVGLIVVGGRKRSPTGKAVFGSTAQQVILNGPAPVTFVRGDVEST